MIVLIQMVYELRTYTAHEGRLDAMNARFRNHTLRLFEKHGMTNVGYWTPQDATLSENTLIYIVAHPSREAAQQAWDAFRADPEWLTVRAESEAGVTKPDHTQRRRGIGGGKAPRDALREREGRGRHRQDETNVSRRVRAAEDQEAGDEGRQGQR